MLENNRLICQLFLTSPHIGISDSENLVFRTLLKNFLDITIHKKDYRDFLFHHVLVWDQI